MAQRVRRIQKEIADCQRDKTSLLKLTLVDESIYHLKGRFPGPPGTPYEGGIFQVDIELSEAYPFQPPKVKFDNKIYHPNVSSQTGAICLDILKNQWSPVLTIASTLLSVQSLLCTPEPNDPQDAQVASHYLADQKGFEETAKFWTECYAKPGPGDNITHGKTATAATRKVHDQSLTANNNNPSSEGSGSQRSRTEVARGDGGTLTSNGSQYQLQQQQQQPQQQQQDQVQIPVVSEEELVKRSKVQELVDMGFESNQARTMLIRAQWQTDAAVDLLLSAST